MSLSQLIEIQPVKSKIIRHETRLSQECFKRIKLINE